MGILSTTWKVIKENPWKFFLGSFSAVFLTVIGMVYSGVSFEHKVDIEKYKADTMLVIKDLQAKVEELTKDLQEKASIFTTEEKPK